MHPAPVTPSVTSPATLAQALASAARLGLPRLDAQLLLLHVLERDDDRAWLITHDGDSLNADQAARFDRLVQRRQAGEPLAYLVGYKEFFGLRLQVDPRVLVPRPDTETLVDWALQVIEDRPAPLLIDLGTGSGAMALAIRSTRGDAHVHALDASADALAVARLNAQRLALPVTFWHGSWLTGHPNDEGYDLIVSNPPYIVEGDEHLPALAHEPRQALTAGDDGLADLRQIVAQATSYLKPGGWLLLEHGYDQASAVRDLLLDTGYWQVQSRRDLAGIERCSGGQWPGQR